MKRPMIVMVNGDLKIRQRLKELVDSMGCEFNVTNDLCEFLACDQKQAPQLIIACAEKERHQDCLTAARLIKEKKLDIPVIILSQFCSEKLVIEALKARVADFYKTPFSYQDLGKRIQELILQRGNGSRNKIDAHASTDGGSQQKIVGKSKAIQKIKAYLLKVAESDSTLLITGETGTGKELVASFVHEKSARKSMPIVCVNCAALPDNLIESELFGYGKGAFTGATVAQKGKFSQASGGTLFLDEIGDMSPFSQAKILRALESKEVSPLGARNAVPVDVRVIAATNQNPESLIQEGRFREDLYFRINVARVHLPPLRQRSEDIPELSYHFMKKFNAKFGLNIQQIANESMDLLTKYTWPGNIRELINVIEAIYIDMLHSDKETAELPDDLKCRMKDAVSFGETDERSRIISTLLNANWNKSVAAKKLQISRMTLYRKIREHHITENRNAVNCRAPEGVVPSGYSLNSFQ